MARKTNSPTRTGRPRPPIPAHAAENLDPPVLAPLAVAASGGLDPANSLATTNRVIPDPSQPKSIICPFSVVIDTREQAPYTFLNIPTNADQGYAPIHVPVIRRAIPSGDYMIQGYPRFVIERKSLADLFGSIGRRDNFIRRLGHWTAHCDQAIVMVEAGIGELLESPPPFSKLAPKIVMRSIQSWTVRYPKVHWVFMPDRRAAELQTFRLLDFYYRMKREELFQSDE